MGICKDINYRIDDIIECYEGCLNDIITRNDIAHSCNSYLFSLMRSRDIDSFQVICNESNNLPCDIDSGKLNVTLNIKIGNNTYILPKTYPKMKEEYKIYDNFMDLDDYYLQGKYSSTCNNLVYNLDRQPLFLWLSKEKSLMPLTEKHCYVFKARHSVIIKPVYNITTKEILG